MPSGRQEGESFSIERFVDDILREAGFVDIPESEKEQYRARLADAVEQRIGAIAMQELDAKGLEEFSAFLSEQGDQPDPGAVLAFFTRRDPDFLNKVRQGLEDFARQFIHEVYDARRRLEK